MALSILAQSCLERLIDGLPPPNWLDLGQGLVAVEVLLQEIPVHLRPRARESAEMQYHHWCERVCAHARQVHWAVPPGWVSWEGFVSWPVPMGCPNTEGWTTWQIWAQVDHEFRVEWGLMHVHA